MQSHILQEEQQLEQSHFFPLFFVPRYHPTLCNAVCAISLWVSAPWCWIYYSHWNACLLQSTKHGENTISAGSVQLTIDRKAWWLIKHSQPAAWLFSLSFQFPASKAYMGLVTKLLPCNSLSGSFHQPVSPRNMKQILSYSINSQKALNLPPMEDIPHLSVVPSLLLIPVIW